MKMDSKTKRLITMILAIVCVIIFILIGEALFDFLGDVTFVGLVILAGLSIYCYSKEEDLILFLKKHYGLLKKKWQDRNKVREPEVVEFEDSASDKE